MTDYQHTFTTVTPPDLYMNGFGPSILFLGITTLDSEPYIKMLEQAYPEVEVSVFIEDQKENKNIAWLKATASLCNTIVVDVMQVSAEELVIALHSDFQGSHKVIWVNLSGSQSNLTTLLNNYQCPIVETMDELEKLLLTSV